MDGQQRQVGDRRCDGEERPQGRGGRRQRRQLGRVCRAGGDDGPVRGRRQGCGHDFPGSLAVEEVSQRGATSRPLCRAPALFRSTRRATLPIKWVCLTVTNSASAPQGAVSVLYGANLFKCAPLLAKLLNQAMLQHPVPANLRGTIEGMRHSTVRYPRLVIRRSGW